MAGRMSRNKGAEGERELSRKLSKLFGVKAHRGRQYSGGPGSPDVIVDIKGIHFECKRTEGFNVYAAMDQSEFDAKGNLPVVCHRRNRQDWVFCCYLYDLPEIVQILKEVVEAKNELDLSKAVERKCGAKETTDTKLSETQETED